MIQALENRAMGMLHIRSMFTEYRMGAAMEARSASIRVQI
jgi:predicted RNA-binding protein (virulence factor B family)